MASDRMDQILDAAYVCFTRHGVRRTTMDDIAQETGMSRAAVYQYVRNKEDAFRRLAERLFDGALTRARADVTGNGDLTERLTAALTSKLSLTLRLWHDSPHAAELLDLNARLSGELAAAYTLGMRDLLAEAIAGDRPDVDAVELAELLLALTRGLETDLADPDLPLRRLHDGVRLLVAGLDHAPTEENA